MTKKIKKIARPFLLGCLIIYLLSYFSQKISGIDLDLFTSNSLITIVISGWFMGFLLTLFYKETLEKLGKKFTLIYFLSIISYCYISTSFLYSKKIFFDYRSEFAPFADLQYWGGWLIALLFCLTLSYFFFSIGRNQAFNLYAKNKNITKIKKSSIILIIITILILPRPHNLFISAKVNPKNDLYKVGDEIELDIKIWNLTPLPYKIKPWHLTKWMSSSQINGTILIYQDNMGSGKMNPFTTIEETGIIMPFLYKKFTKKIKLIEPAWGRQNRYLEDQFQVNPGNNSIKIRWNDPGRRNIKNINIKIDESSSDWGKIYDYIGERNYKKVLELIEKGVDVNKNPLDQSTPLIEACFFGNYEMIKLLLENGANVNLARNGDNTTPLIQATNYGGDINIIKLLIEHGANVNDKDKYGKTPLFYAANNGKSEMAKFLLEKGADIWSKTESDETILHASGRGNLDWLALYLIQNGLNVNEKAENGETPLHWTAYKNSTSTARILLENEAEKDAITNFYKETPLHIAAQYNNFEITKLLDLYGANMNALNSLNRTPLDVSEYRHHNYDNQETYKYLIEHGLTRNELENNSLEVEENYVYKGVPDESLESTEPIDKKWNLYKNEKLGFSIKIPNKIDNGPLEVINFAMGEDTIYYIEIRTNEKDAYKYSWKIKSLKIESEDTAEKEIEEWIKQIYGSECVIGSKNLVSGKDYYQYSVPAVSYKKTPEEINKLCKQGLKIVFFSPEHKKAFTWNAGNGFSFYNTNKNEYYDDDIINSFEFIN